MTEAARTSETLLNFYHITRRYNLEDSHLHLRVCLRTTFGKTFPSGDKAGILNAIVIVMAVIISKHIESSGFI
jgi:hypothetical protein